jgi:hypothetical protein
MEGGLKLSLDLQFQQLQFIFSLPRGYDNSIEPRAGFVVLLYGSTFPSLEKA